MDQIELMPVGRVRRAHGTRGVLVVEAQHPALEDLLEPGRRFIAANHRGQLLEPEVVLTVQLAEPFQDAWRVQFDEITDRSTAEMWRGRHLLVPPDELPPPDEDTIDPADLVGIEVFLPDGTPVGLVEAFYELRHDLIIEVARPEGSVMIPYRDEFVESVDMEQRRIVVNPPPGLLDG